MNCYFIRVATWTVGEFRCNVHSALFLLDVLNKPLSADMNNTSDRTSTWLSVCFGALLPPSGRQVLDLDIDVFLFIYLLLLLSLLLPRNFSQMSEIIWKHLSFSLDENSKRSFSAPFIISPIIGNNGAFFKQQRDDSIPLLLVATSFKVTLA